MKTVKTAKFYREAILKDLSQFIINQKNDREVIIIGDFNESIKASRIEGFLTENGLFDVYRWYNGADEETRESMYEYGRKCIDVFTTIAGVMQFIDGCKVVNFFEVISIDYRRYIVDVNLQEFFQVKQFNIDRIDSSKLDSRRATH